MSLFYFRLENLLDLGADPRITNDSGQNCLFILISLCAKTPFGFGNNQQYTDLGNTAQFILRAVKLLIDHVKSNYGEKELISFVNRQDKNSVTSLHIAV